ncbi:MAG: LysR family transcriptional regulator, partial [Gammaproteobacteria bacterium]|nr:LysR family transcriptional regulator [Gammaproteobacteria bacterium]
MKDTLEAGLSTTTRIEVGPDRTIGFLGEALRI